MPKLQWIPVEALKPNPRNARTHSRKQVHQIADSITAFGFVAPIVANEHRRILIGHGRYEAAKLLGLKRVPVIELSGLSEAKLRALALADNRIAQNAGWNRELLAAELTELSEVLIEEGLDISITAFVVPEIDQLMADFEEDATDPADAVNPNWAAAAPVTKRGELWQLGDHRLLCGDARNGSDLAHLMDGSRAAMAFP